MAARFWVTTGTTGGTGNWSDVQNWSATSGGAAGASVPGSADTVAFDASSGAGTATVDSNVTIQTLTMNGFTGTLAFGTNTITVNGNSGTVFTGATTHSVTGTPVINVTPSGSPTALTVTPVSVTEANSISFNFTTGTYTLSFLNTVSNTARNVDFTGFSGTWAPRSNVTIYGSITLSTGMTVAATASTLTLGATSGTQLITSNGKTFDNPISVIGAGTRRLVDAFTMGPTRTLGVQAGTFDLNNNSLVTGFFNSSYVNVRTLAFGTGNITCNGAGGTLWDTSSITNLTVTGTPSVNISNSGATATSVLTGALSQANSISFSFTTGTYALTFLSTVNYTARNVIFTGFAGTWADRTTAHTIYGNLTISTGMNSGSAGSTGVLTFGATSGVQVFTSNTSTVRDINFPVTVNGVGGTVQLADSLRITKNLVLTNGTFDANSVGIALTGSGTFSMTTGSVSIKGVTTTGAFALAFSQASGTLTQVGNNTFRAFTLTAGTLNLGSYTFTCESFTSSNTNVRTIAFGTGNITCANTTGGTLWSTPIVTNMTVTGTPTVNISYPGAATVVVNTGGLSEANSISFNFTTGSYALDFLTNANHSARDVTFSNTGFSGTWNARLNTNPIYGSLTLSGLMTMPSATGMLTFAATSGTKFITSNGATLNTPITFNGIGGTWQLADAFILATGKGFTITNGTFDGNFNSMSVVNGIGSTTAGSNGTLKNVITSNLLLVTSPLNLGGPVSVGTTTFNSGTFNLAGNTFTCSSFSSSGSGIRTIAFGSGNITVSNNAGGTLWTTATATNLTVTGTPVVNISNSGSGATSVITGILSEAQSISFNFINGTYTLTFLANASYAAKNVNFTGFSGTWNVTSTATIYGNLTLSSSAGFSTSLSASAITFGATSGAQIITSNAKTINFSVTVNGVGGTVRLADALLMNTLRNLTHTNGTLDLNGNTLTVGATYITATGTKNLTFNGGTLVCPAVTATAFNNAAPTNFTTTAGTGTGKISMTGATAKTFVGGGSTYDCTLSNDGAGALTLSGANTFTTIANGVQPTAFVFPISITQTVTNWTVSGTAGNLVTITSGTAGTPATLSKASGIVSSNYLSLKDSAATGGATWYAGANSTNVSGNSGWIFSNAPSNAAGSFFFMF